MNTTRYMTPDDLKKIVDPKTKSFTCTIRGMQIELIDKRPQMVLYVDEDPRGIILTRQLYHDLTRTLGPCEAADRFFQDHGVH